MYKLVQLQWKHSEFKFVPEVLKSGKNKKVFFSFKFTCYAMPHTQPA
jgi:hypothetical protein